MTNIHVVDQIMGAGKTTAAINLINENPSEHYIYITPYLSEVDRIEEACKFLQPKKLTENTPKSVDLKRLLAQGKNIVTTHSLFSYFDEEAVELCHAQGYTLIMDEVHNVVEAYKMKKLDLDMMLENHVEVQENGILKWKDENRDTEKYQNEKRLCEMGCLAVYSDTALIWLFPIKIFEAFKETYILTYLFGAQIQRYYYDFYNIEYDRMYVDRSNYSFTYEKPTDERLDIDSLINIVEIEKMNAIGDGDYSLSKGWYEKNSGNLIMKQLKNNILNFFMNLPVLPTDGGYIKSNAKANLWTTFTDFKSQLQGKGYTKGFIPLNMRATNEFKDRSVVAYAVNVYFNPIMKNFFSSNNIKVDEDLYALSEMIQCIWRSAIRENRQISVYIPSKRMRELLQVWLYHIKTKGTCYDY